MSSTRRKETLARERDERQKKALEDQTKKAAIARRMIEGAHPADGALHKGVHRDGDPRYTGTW